VDRVVELLETGDPSVMTGAYSADAAVWHNNDGVDVPCAQAFGGAGSLHGLVDGLYVEVVRELRIDGGVAVQVELRGTVRSTGAALRARNCMFLFEDGGVLQRIEEYLDPTFTIQLGL
jgi:ketosteroid isomerase-like protein